MGVMSAGVFHTPSLLSFGCARANRLDVQSRGGSRNLASDVCSLLCLAGSVVQLVALQLVPLFPGGGGTGSSHAPSSNPACAFALLLSQTVHADSHSGMQTSTHALIPRQ